MNPTLPLNPKKPRIFRIHLISQPGDSVNIANGNIPLIP